VASDRERADQVSPTPRRQVLRPGIRIVAEQFAPYDDGPDVEYVLLGLNPYGEPIYKEDDGSQVFTWNIAFGRMSGKSAAIRQIEEIGTAAHEALEKLLKLPPAFWLDEVQIDPYPRPIEKFSSDHRPLRNDGKPKKPKLPQPYYVELDKRKRR
jgi:hypothetical protein